MREVIMLKKYFVQLLLHTRMPKIDFSRSWAIIPVVPVRRTNIQKKLLNFGKYWLTSIERYLCTTTSALCCMSGYQSETKNCIRPSQLLRVQSVVTFCSPTRTAQLVRIKSVLILDWTSFRRCRARFGGFSKHRIWRTVLRKWFALNLAVIFKCKYS